ncbi:protein AGENET DOMAIN (AGD)-CONTAINING P1-like [Telopea speciosissima]|uniref:protein AGENET DOMAIN (AGD)-CONTAINING P1-like n=1 Tax=Telopea speciosissima TaxID=54955 RepID=UPI001CC4B374|nr:protein AGENET DOMAIN (AGD)-CONTAINING P1-like [Telopea speciosissima]
MAKAYRTGDFVEICSNDEGFLGSYFAAKVLAVGKTKLLVEYETLLTPDESGLLKEIVHYREVRPRPPEIPVSAFRVFEEVDAYDNEGWWVGRITSVQDSNKYSVYFSHSRENNTYPFFRLRVHQDWKNGKWVSPRSHR